MAATRVAATTLVPSGRPSEGDQTLHAVAVERYDCASRTYALTEMRYHAEGDGGGAPLETVAIPENRVSYLTPAPGTVNEQLLNQVCGAKR